MLSLLSQTPNGPNRSQRVVWNDIRQVNDREGNKVEPNRCIEGLRQLVYDASYLVAETPVPEFDVNILRLARTLNRTFVVLG